MISKGSPQNLAELQVEMDLRRCQQTDCDSHICSGIVRFIDTELTEFYGRPTVNSYVCKKKDRDMFLQRLENANVHECDVPKDTSAIERVTSTILQRPEEDEGCQSDPVLGGLLVYILSAYSKGYNSLLITTRSTTGLYVVSKELANQVADATRILRRMVAYAVKFGVKSNYHYCPHNVPSGWDSLSLTEDFLALDRVDMVAGPPQYIEFLNGVIQSRIALGKPTVISVVSKLQDEMTQNMVEQHCCLNDYILSMEKENGIN